LFLQVEACSVAVPTSFPYGVVCQIHISFLLSSTVLVFLFRQLPTDAGQVHTGQFRSSLSPIPSTRRWGIGVLRTEEILLHRWECARGSCEGGPSANFTGYGGQLNRSMQHHLIS
jgi:hypothetical protein